MRVTAQMRIRCDSSRLVVLLQTMLALCVMQSAFVSAADIVDEVRILREAGATIVECDGVPRACLASYGDTARLSKALKSRTVELRERELAALASIRTIEAISASDERLGDAGFMAITRLPSIKYLDVANTGITAAGCKNLHAMKDLTHLQISGNKIGSEGIAEIGKCAGLQALELFWVGLEESDLKIVGNLKELTWLRVGEKSRSAITDEGIAQLQNPKLEKLYIKYTAVRGPGLANAAYRDSLKSLIANHSLFDDSGLAAVRNYSNLRFLDVRATKITDEGIAQLRGMKSLDRIDLSHTRTTNACLQSLKQIPNLRIVNIGDTRIDEAQLTAVCAGVEYQLINEGEPLRIWQYDDCKQLPPLEE